MDLSKAFGCVLHGLSIVKVEAYGINENLHAFLHSYLSNRKPCVRNSDVTSDFETITSGIPQGSIVSPVLFNCFFNNFFYFIEKSSVHNFEDDETLSMFKETIQKSIALLEIDKIIKPSSSVKLLGFQIDDQLNFNLHISNNCRSAENQLNVLIRLKRFLAFEEKKNMVNSYFYSNFNYCLLVWMFYSAKSLNKVESLQKRAFCFLYDKYNSSYESILKHAGKSTMNVTRLKSFCIEI